MRNKLWWGYKYLGCLYCFEYHPGKDQYEEINKAENVTFYVVYPFEEYTREEAFIRISKKIQEMEEVKL
jgi:hypothetical protein